MNLLPTKTHETLIVKEIALVTIYQSLHAFEEWMQVGLVKIEHAIDMKSSEGENLIEK